MHTTPASVFKIVFSEDKTRKFEKYKGQNKWVETDEDELKKLVDIGSAREVEKDIAKEFIIDFDKNNFLE